VDRIQWLRRKQRFTRTNYGGAKSIKENSRDKTMEYELRAPIKRLINALERKHWKVSLKPDRNVDIGFSLRSRFAVLPEDFLFFLSMVELCEDSTKSIWFLTDNDYSLRKERSLAWNFFETLSLEACLNGYFLEGVSSVTRFWSRFLPIALSARAEYAYLAIGIHPGNFGQIIYGFEPEFEESAHVICTSFSQLCEHYADMVEGKQHFIELEEFI